MKNIDASVFFGDDIANPDTVGRFYGDMQMFADQCSGVDPEGYMASWTTSQVPGQANSFLGRNVQRFQSDEYDLLHARLQETFDPQERNRITIALNNLLVQSYSIIPLIHRGFVSAHARGIEKVSMNSWDSELWNFDRWTRRK